MIIIGKGIQRRFQLHGFVPFAIDFGRLKQVKAPDIVVPSVGGEIQPAHGMYEGIQLIPLAVDPGPQVLRLGPDSPLELRPVNIKSPQSVRVIGCKIEGFPVV